MAKYKVARALSVMAISAGAFGFISNGNVLAYSENGDYAIPEGSSNEELYDDLKLAISDGKNVKLNSDIEHYVTVSNSPSIDIDHSMILDLNGHVLATASTSGGSVGNTGIAVSGEGTVLTINDTSTGKNGAIRYDHKGNTAPTTVWINAGAKVVLNGGSIYSPYGRATANGEGMAVNMKGAGSSFEMNGGGVYSHEDSTSTSNFGVRFNNAGSFKLTGGTIETVGNALSGSKAIELDVTGGSLVSTKDKAVYVTSTSNTGKISGVTIKDMVLAGAVELKNDNVTDSLEVKGGTRDIIGTTVGALTIAGGITTVKNTTISGLTTVTSGTVTFDDGAKLNGGLTYQSASNAILTVHEGASVAGFSQLGKTTTVSYTDSATKEKVSASYDTYGSLVIDGGDFTGGFVTVTPTQVEEANAARKAYVDSYNEHSGKTPITYGDVASVPAVSGGVFATKPDNDTIVGGYDIYDVSPDGPYYVDEAVEVNLPDKIVLGKGDTYAVEIPAVAKKYGTLGGANEIVSVDSDNVITATSVGTGLMNFNLHNYLTPFEKNIDVLVYDVEARKNDDSDDNADRLNIESFFAEQVKEALQNGTGSFYNTDKATIYLNGLRDVLEAGDSLVSGVIINQLDIDDAESSVGGYDQLLAALGDKEEILAFYNATVALTNSDLSNAVGFANQLNAPVTVRFGIPDGYTNLKGIFSILRIHWDNATQQYQIDRLPSTREGNDLLAENDRFSTFVIAYAEVEDNPEEEPEEEPEKDSEETEKSDGSAKIVSPESGTMTVAGASASAAALVTAIIVGLMTSVASFIFLIRKH